jgi:hypothetical protein
MGHRESGEHQGGEHQHSTDGSDERVSAGFGVVSVGCAARRRDVRFYSALPSWVAALGVRVRRGVRAPIGR